MRTDARSAEALAPWRRGPCAVLAGGTDFYPARVGRPLRRGRPRHHARSPACAASREDGGGWRIGALTTWTDVLAAPRCRRCSTALKLAAREVGGVQIQNAGTLGGNLCNASPAADGMPRLLALDARGGAGSRRAGAARVPLGGVRARQPPDRAARPTSW